MDGLAKRGAIWKPFSRFRYEGEPRHLRAIDGKDRSAIRYSRSIIFEYSVREMAASERGTRSNENSMTRAI